MDIIKRMVQLLASALPNRRSAHAWRYNSAHTHRICTTCGRMAQFDAGGGVDAPIWLLTERGDALSHRIEPLRPCG